MLREPKRSLFMPPHGLSRRFFPSNIEWYKYNILCVCFFARGVRARIEFYQRGRATEENMRFKWRFIRNIEFQQRTTFVKSIGDCSIADSE